MSIKLENLCFSYEAGTAFEKKALIDINLEIQKGEFVGLIGHTGSGKSTLIQHMNGLNKPTSGRVLFDGEDIFAVKDSRSLRRKVGLVFQYPEYQLFESTVIKDVSFGPKNMGLPEEEVRRRAEDAIALVGLSPDIYEVSPFDISGGQKRRVAIAGILAMEPDYLILDEPTAGLDPAGRTEILNQINRLQDERGIAVILVSHSMDDVANYVDRVVALSGGRIVLDGPTREVFSKVDELEAVGLSVPQVTKLGKLLGLPGTLLTLDEAEEALKKSGLLKKAGAAE